MANYPAGYRPQGEAGEAGHETIDLSLRRILIAGVVLFVVCVFTFVLSASLMRGYRTQERTIESERPPLFADRRGLYPEPRLQENPSADLRAMRKADEAELSGYGWVDRKAGVVKIPIERAIEIVAKKRLPARGSEASSKSRSTNPKPEAVKSDTPAASSETKGQARPGGGE